jgi:aromatic-L-amino-acid decarboxylase
MAHELKSWIEEHPDFDILAPVLFNLVCFRFHPREVNDMNELNRLNETLLLNVNGTGRIYISHTKLNGMYSLRMVTGQTRVELSHVKRAWDLILEKAYAIYPTKM